MNTSIAKTKTGWEGNTRMEMGGGRVLCIMTAKASDGSLVTTASVRHVVRGSHGATETSTRHDYFKHWIRWTVRATEKQVREQHGRALDMVAEVMPSIEKHYGIDRA